MIVEAKTVPIIFIRGISNRVVEDLWMVIRRVSQHKIIFRKDHYCNSILLRI